MHKASLTAPLQGVRQEYWQSLSYPPSTAQAGLDKMKVNKLDGKTQTMLKKAGGSHNPHFKIPQEGVGGGVTQTFIDLLQSKMSPIQQP